MIVEVAGKYAEHAVFARENPGEPTILLSLRVSGGSCKEADAHESWASNQAQDCSDPSLFPG